MKQCSKCEQLFLKNEKGSNGGWCASCAREYNRKYYEDNREAELAKRKRYYDAHREQCCQEEKARRDAIRLETFDQYGGQFCACCGEETLKFLTLDHINGGGVQHRKSLNGLCGTNFYKWLKKHNWPEGYQVLCYNCNCGKAYNNGICPHEETN